MTARRERRSSFVLSWRILLAIMTASAGCASAVEGSRQEISISSEPPGASVLVDGSNLGTTPAVVELGRRHNHSVRIEKTGYLAYETTTSSTLTNWQWADLLPMIVFPPLLVVLYFDDGAYEVNPNQIVAHLVAAAPSSSESSLNSADSKLRAPAR